MTSSSPFTRSPFPTSPFPAAPLPSAPSPGSSSPPSPLPARQSDIQEAAIAGLAPGPSLEAIVREAHTQGYSDVHLGVGEGPRFRCRGDIQRTAWPTTDAATFASWLKELLSPTQIDGFRRDKEFDGSFGFDFVRVRINLLDTLLGPAMVLRLIPQTIPSIEELGLPAVLQEICQRPKGLVLVTGPTGSGKSTTMAAMVNHINRTMARHILTIEDPVEFVHHSQQSLIRQREVGQHTKVFDQALRAALREDPDVILIGEIRDQETLTTALEASQTGHLVFGTLHTNSAVKTVERVLGMVAHSAQTHLRLALSESLLAVIAQGLVKTADGKRTAFHDILLNSDACKDYIQRGELEEIEAIMGRSAFEWMRTANQSLALLVETGRVEPGDAIAQSLKPNELSQVLRGRQ